MRKTSLFKNDDLAPAETKAERFRRIKAETEAALQNLDPDKAEKIAAKHASKEKKLRYAPLKDGTRAIGRLVLDKKAIAKDADGNAIFAYDVRESNGARWIDGKFILEGKYNRRWIKMRFMLSGKSNQTRDLVKATRRSIRAICLCHQMSEKSPLSHLDELRVPLIIGQGPRHGDGKIANYISAILSPDPMDRNYHLYEEFAKSRKVILMPDSCGNKRRWIDFPGWHFFPFTPLYQTLKERIDTYHQRVSKNAQRALSKMENAA